MKDTEDVIALEAPPCTLEVKHFAKARAAELLSLHAALKKRKAAREEENQDKSKKDSISLPRHLRRRTSSYTHRRCPLPWLYKQKKRTTAHTKSPSLTQSDLHPEKKARVQRKESHLDSTEHDQNLRLEKEGNSDQCKRKRLCRSLRRLLELKPGGLLVANDGTRRLSTHVWHAKRFSMEKKFGYYLPIGRPGKYVFLNQCF
jgi:ribonuclease P/MRP protein subunit POP1